MRKTSALLVGVALLSASATPSIAGTVTYFVEFAASGFHLPIGAPPVPVPVDPVTGSFTITFDPAHDYATDTTAGITFDSLNLTLGSTLAFQYDHTSDLLAVGGTDAGVNGIRIAPESNDFGIGIHDFTGASPFSHSLSYTQSVTGNGHDFFTSSVTVSVTATPIPATLPLFLAALGTVCTALYVAGRRRPPDPLRV